MYKKPITEVNSINSDRLMDPVVMSWGEPASNQGGNIEGD